MKQILRKMNLSIITCALILVLSVTTTYAWAGLQNYSNVENIDFSLESSESYKIQLSLDGLNFYDQLGEYEIKTAILKNMGIIEEGMLVDETFVNKNFNNIVLEPLTTKRIGKELGVFVNIDEIREDGFIYDSTVESKEAKQSYFNFDFYVAINYIGNETDEHYLTDYQELYIKDIKNLLTGEQKTYRLKANHILENYLKGETLSNVKVNSKSAVRMSFTKYETRYREMIGFDFPKETIIFQGGTATPTIEDDVYSFGGFLNSSDNLAYMDFNNIHSHNPININVFNDFYENRKNDEGFEEAISIDEINGVNHKLISIEDKLDTNHMIRFNVKMWLEGFDADCFEVISKTLVGFNLKLLHYDLH